jgi:hypothetical protein
MRIEIGGFVIVKLQDGRYHAMNSVDHIEFIADSLEEVDSVVQLFNK